MSRTACCRTVLILWALALVCAAPGSGQTTATGTVEGRVLDGLTGSPLPGAKVTVEGTVLSASTDRQGVFRLLAVPQGARVLVVSYVGRKEERVDVTVAPGVTVAPEVRLQGEYVYEETVTVTAELIADAQARALNQQKTAPSITNVVSADQIGRFPDPNAADTTQRIPGISIQRDQGEGRYVIIRGTEPRLNSMMIDGERIPAPDANVRQVALDVIPSDLLQSIEVSKALTPDMDADAIGGSVNLVMKQAPDRFRVLATGGGGYNRMLESYAQGSGTATIGRRFVDKKVGVILSGSGNGIRRGNHDFEPLYSAGNLTDLDIRDYTVIRRRYGTTGALDFKQSNSSSYVVRGVYNYYIDDHELRQRLRERVANSRLERELRDRTHIEHIASLAFSGAHVLKGAEFDYKLSGAYSDQDDPLTITTTFRQSRVTFAPNVTPTSIDPNNIQANPLNENLSAYTLNQQLRARNFTKDRDVVGLGNLRFTVRSTAGMTTFLKVGGKYRDKLKTRARNENILTSPTAIPLAGFLDTGVTPNQFLDGRYNIGSFINPQAARDLPNQYSLVVRRNYQRDAEEFSATERVAAGYVMGELYVGSKLFVLPGLRYEYTSSEYTGNEVLFSETGAYVATRPVTGTSNYGVALPGVHVRYALTPSSNLRVSVTRSLARPNYYDLVPYRAVNDQENTMSMGNSGLQPTKSWNVDLMAERFLKSIGVVSAGFFYKRMQDYIYVYTYDQIRNGETYRVTQPLNGESASIRGFEFAVQNQLTFLPKPFDGIGLYANYTLSDSTAVFPGRAGAKATLPGQAKHVGNLAGSYEKRGFSGRVSINFSGAYIDQVGLDSTLDRYYDTHRQVDLSFSQQVAKGVGVYLNALNLNNAPLRYYQGVTDRPLQEERYRWWLDFGIKIDF